MAEINVVMTTVPYSKEHLKKLKEAFEPAEFISLDRKDAAGIVKALERADVAVLASDLDERFIAAPRMKWIHCDHAGLNKSAKPAVFEKGLIVTSSAGRSSPALAEHALYFMLSFTFAFPAFYKAQLAHQWGIEIQDSLRGLYGRTLGIVGMGNTGCELAVRAKALGMRVLGYRRHVSDAPPGVDRLYCADAGDSLDELLKLSDFIVLALPLSDKTYHLISERELDMMKPSAYLINMARGAVIDEKAMLKALKGGRIAGAGLDTFEQEPLPAGSPLWDIPNIIITPHVTPQVLDRTERSLEIIAENARRYRAGEPMLNLLKKEDVYSK